MEFSIKKRLEIIDDLYSKWLISIKDVKRQYLLSKENERKSD